MRAYYGWNEEEKRVMYAVITGQMEGGQYVYTEYDPINDELVDIDKQYSRHLKGAHQWFIYL